MKTVLTKVNKTTDLLKKYQQLLPRLTLAL